MRSEIGVHPGRADRGVRDLLPVQRDPCVQRLSFSCPGNHAGGETVAVVAVFGEDGGDHDGSCAGLFEAIVYSSCDAVADPKNVVFGDDRGAVQDEKMCSNLVSRPQSIAHCTSMSRRDARSCLRVRSQLMSTPITTARWRPHAD